MPILKIKYDIWVDKSWLKKVNLCDFLKEPEAYGYTVLPDRLILKWLKLMENAKIKKWTKKKIVSRAHVLKLSLYCWETQLCH